MTNDTSTPPAQNCSQTPGPVNDGGPAFPQVANHIYCDGAIAVPVPYAGMSLRDYMAAKAMQGDLASQSAETGEWSNGASIAALAKRAYEIADAMLAARAGGAA